jgi:hypothetical protein
MDLPDEIEVPALFSLSSQLCRRRTFDDLPPQGFAMQVCFGAAPAFMRADGLIDSRQALRAR